MEYLEMCDQCLVNPIYFGQPLVGFTLARARRDGCEDWKKGEWGLIEVNDPTYYNSKIPGHSRVCEPTYSLNDAKMDLVFCNQNRTMEELQ